MDRCVRCVCGLLYYEDWNNACIFTFLIFDIDFGWTRVLERSSMSSFRVMSRVICDAVDLY